MGIKIDREARNQSETKWRDGANFPQRCLAKDMESVTLYDVNLSVIEHAIMHVIQYVNPL